VEKLLMPDEALTRLARMYARQARVVENAYFCGITKQEATEALRASPRTVKHGWGDSRAWLQAEIPRPRP
jgi:hypothetical protein